MSVAIVSIHLLEIGDFEFGIKQKTLSYSPTISPVGQCKDTFFFLQCNALLRILFLQSKYFIETIEVPVRLLNKTFNSKEILERLPNLAR